MEESPSLFSSEFDTAIEQVKKQKEGTQSATRELPEGVARDVLVAPDPKLRFKAKEVEKVDDSCRQLVADLLETMYKSQGIGLASTQIGDTRRVIVMDVPNLSAYQEDVEQDIKTHGMFIMVNPHVLESGEHNSKWAEGCLSVPGFQFEIERPAFIVAAGLSVNGDPIQFRAAGLLSACIQHEIDHLDGKLFIDYVSRLKRDIVIKKLKKFRVKGKMIVRAHNAPRM